MSIYQELKRRNVLRVAIAYITVTWVMLQAVDVVLNNIDAPVWIFQTILLVLVVGFVPALMFSWAFELTHEGVKRESEVNRNDSITHHTGRKLSLLVVVFGAIGIVYFVYGRLISGGVEEAQQVASSIPAADSMSIAVLPFTNLSGDPDTEPFTLGMHDDLLTHLSRIKALKTTSRTSVLQYKDTTKTIPQIAGELIVANILEGSIQRSGNRVRINMQLIDARTDEHLWGEIYDRDLTAENLFEVQAGIATAVSKALSVTLLPEEQSALEETPTQSMAAYDLYLLGRYHWNFATAESAELALDYFSQAIASDPDYILALSGQADAYVALENYGNLTGREAFPMAQEALDHAMSLDDDVSEVWASLGQLRYSTRDFTGAVEALERAIALDEKNFWAWYRYGEALHNLRRFTDSLSALQTAYSLEPMSRPINETLGQVQFHRGNFAQARQHFERVDQLQDKDPTDWKEAIARTYLESGELTRAIVVARQVLALDPNNVDAMGILVDAYIRLGELEEAELWAKRAESVDAYNTSMVDIFRAREDFEGGITYLEDWVVRAVNRPPFIPFVCFELAHQGQMEESAEAYLREFLAHYGNRPPISPYDFRPRFWLFGIEWWLNYERRNSRPFLEPDGTSSAARNKESLARVTAGLENMNSQGYQHPDTYYAMGMARALQNDLEGALQALDTAVTRGYSNPGQFSSEFALDSLRDDPRLTTIEDRLYEHIQQERRSLSKVQLAEYHPADQRSVIILPRDTLEHYTGYFSDGNVVLHYYLDDRGQFALKVGQAGAPVALVASSDGEFFDPDVPADMHQFARDDSGEVSHVMVTYGGRSDRFKSVTPPPAAISLDQAILERYVGTYSGNVITEAEGGTSDVDVWVIRMFIDEKGNLWRDHDNQPDLMIQPYSETQFYTPGFMSRQTFVVDPASGIAGRFLMHWDRREIVFERQE